MFQKQIPTTDVGYFLFNNPDFLEMFIYRITYLLSMTYEICGLKEKEWTGKEWVEETNYYVREKSTIKTYNASISLFSVGFLFLLILPGYGCFMIILGIICVLLKIFNIYMQKKNSIQKK